MLNGVKRSYIDVTNRIEAWSYRKRAIPEAVSTAADKIVSRFVIAPFTTDY
jgi:hypothetical protein